MGLGYVPSQFGGTYISSRGYLVRRVTENFGNTTDQELNDVALSLLDETIKEMNSHLYEFNKVHQTGITLSDGVESYTLNSQFFREVNAILIRGSDSLQRFPLTYLPYPEYEKRYAASSVFQYNRGEPLVYTMYNWHLEGIVRIRPVPSGSFASDFALQVNYYRRIPLASASDPLPVPQELEPALIYGAQKRMAIHLNGAADPDVAAYSALERSAIDKLEQLDRRHPDEQARFRVVDNYNQRTYPQNILYIKI